MDTQGAATTERDHPDLSTGRTARLKEENAVLREELKFMRRELLATHELTAVMHASQDTRGVQQRVLQLVAGDLGYEHAVLARYDPHQGVLTGWDMMSAAADGDGRCLQDIPLASARLALKAESGPLAAAALSWEPALLPEGEPPASDPVLSGCLGTGSQAVLPLVLRGQLLGVLLVSNPVSRRPITSRDLDLLANIARQASLVLGSLQMCIDRAQRTAIEEERGRIAIEIHDTVSQHLYGIAYTLDASVRLLPGQAEQVRERLTYLLPQVQEANSAIRQIIFDLWPEEFDSDRFVEQVRAYVHEMSPPGGPDVEIHVDHHFDALPATARKHIYLVVQEALSNVIKHAEASRASVTLAWNPVELSVRVWDNGQGFDAAAPLMWGRDKARFGLQGMRDRAQSLGGTLRLESGAGEGTEVVLTVPLGY